MAEIKQVVNTSQRGSINWEDMKSLMWTLLITIGSVAISALTAWMTATLVPYLQEHPSIGANVILAIVPTMTTLLIGVGKYLQKLLDGPSEEQVRVAESHGVPEGFERSTGLERIEKQ